MTDDFPTPISDPEAEGLPGVADDDSGADDEVLTGRAADGPAPAPLPGDSPAAVDGFGVTPEEARDGESVEYKLRREEREPPVEEPLGAPADPDLALEADNEQAARQAQFDADVLEPGPTSDPRSPVSIYDQGDLEQPGATGQPVGRLVEPDEGWREDDEPDSVAYDAGAAGGGPTAEELAVHETPPPG
jgi:hypothetical protein